MGYINANIPYVIGLYRINKRNKKGFRVIALSRSSKLINLTNIIDYVVANNLKLDAYDYFGDINISGVLNYFPSELEKYVKVKTIRDYRDFACLLKVCNINEILNPIDIGYGITYDCPFIYYNNQPVCMWKPTFESIKNGNQFKLKDGCLVYEYKNPIFLLSDTQKRHIAADLYECLYINLNTKRITCSLHSVIDNEYICCDAVSIGIGVWQEFIKELMPILGYKSV